MATDGQHRTNTLTAPRALRAQAYEGQLPSYDDLARPAPGLSDRDRARRRMLVAGDAAGLMAAYGCVELAAAGSAGVDRALLILAWLPFCVLLIRSLGLYDRDRHLIHNGTLDELPRLALAVFIAGSLLFIVAPPLTGVELGRGHTVGLIVFGLLLVALLRSATRSLIRRRYDPERCLIVGSGLVARLVAQKVAAHPEYGVSLVGFVDVESAGPRGPAAASRNGGGHVHHMEQDAAPRLGDHARFARVCREFGVERVVIAFTSLGHEELLEVVATSKALNLKITVVPRLFEAVGHRVEIDQVEGMTLHGIRGVCRPRSAMALKRALDIALSGLLLLVLSPLLLAIALVVKLTSPGPVLFTQQRIGRDDRPFRMLKFRTMIAGADALKPQLAHLNEADGPMFKIADDPRLTPIGRRLRRMSLDELPQLWNVLRGEMSIVGPRPLVPSEDHQIIGRHRDRLRLAPGLTGPWQVLGRTAIPFQEMVKLDYLYVAEWSLWNDVKLMLRTVPVILQARGH
ncbi:MAG: sugar transferase [Chloroflexota bacterium]|nr:sugar transferase [Chloroflexota bacterium]